MNIFQTYLESTKQPSIVYHITHPKNIKNILTNGVSVSSNSIEGIKLANPKYSNRLFLALDKESAYRIAQEIGNFINSKIKKPTNQMTVIVIDFEKFINNKKVRTYKDPDFQATQDSAYDFHGAGGIFIKENIPAEFIIKKYNIRLEDW